MQFFDIVNIKITTNITNNNATKIKNGKSGNFI